MDDSLNASIDEALSKPLDDKENQTKNICLWREYKLEQLMNGLKEKFFSPSRRRSVQSIDVNPNL